jgi:hypothetical protein
MSASASLCFSRLLFWLPEIPYDRTNRQAGKRHRASPLVATLSIPRPAYKPRFSARTFSKEANPANIFRSAVEEFLKIPADYPIGT